MAKKEQVGKVYLIYNKKGEILIRKRTEKGLLSGLYEFPWGDDIKVLKNAKDTSKEITHIFTHIKLTLKIYIVNSDKSPIKDGIFVAPEELDKYALSTLMKKVYAKMA